MRRRARITLLGAVLVAIASAGAGCAAGVTEVASRTAGSEPSVPERSAASDVMSDVTSDAVVDAFVADAGFAALPRAEVLLGGTGGADAALRVVAVVADGPGTRSRGLMGVPALPDGVGMLFAFPDATGPERPGFWMLDTLVPLDIAFAADGVVVGTATMQPCTSAPCPVTHPGVAYDVALEVAAGALDAAGVGPGDRFAWRVEGSPWDASGSEGSGGDTR